MVADVLRIIQAVFTYYNSDLLDSACLIHRDGSQVMSGVFWFVYHVLTYCVPMCMIIRLLYIFEDQFAIKPSKGNVCFFFKRPQRKQYDV